MKTIIIIASARKNGNTAAIASEFANFANCDTVNLFDYNILPYDYENKNHLDDFIPLLVKLIKEYAYPY